MTDIELNKAVESAKTCNKYFNDSSRADPCIDCLSENPNRICWCTVQLPDEVKVTSCLSDRLDALTAELAEKDRRIAELEAGQKHGKWVDNGHYCCKCTACGNHVLGNTSESLSRYNFRPYCENCGAKMDGE